MPSAREHAATVSWQAHLPHGADPQALDLLAAESLPRAWVKHFVEAPERPAFCDTERRSLSYRELDRRSRTVAARFAAAA